MTRSRWFWLLTLALLLPAAPSTAAILYACAPTYGTLSAAAAVCSNQTMLIDCALPVGATTVTVPATCEMSFTAGGSIVRTSGQTVTLNGPWSAPKDAFIFTGGTTGYVVGASCRMDHFNPRWIGATGAYNLQSPGASPPDDTAAIQWAIDATQAVTGDTGANPVHGATVHNSHGTYHLSSPGLSMPTNVIFEGEGRNTRFTTSLSLATCTGGGTCTAHVCVSGSNPGIPCHVGFPLIHAAALNVCQTSGTGYCDMPLHSGGRGQNCICYANDDCQSGHCAGGSTTGGSRRVQLRDFEMSVYNEGSIGVDLANMSESQVNNVYVFGSNNGHVNTIGFHFDDSVNLGTPVYSDHQLTCYDNLVVNSEASEFDVCAWFDGEPNINAIRESVLANNCKMGTYIGHLVTKTVLDHNNYASPRVADCTGNVCVGGGMAGQACSTTADCGAYILDLGWRTAIKDNWFEGQTTVPDIILGLPGGTLYSNEPTVEGNHFSSVILTPILYNDVRNPHLSLPAAPLPTLVASNDPTGTHRWCTTCAQAPARTPCTQITPGPGAEAVVVVNPSDPNSLILTCPY